MIRKQFLRESKNWYFKGFDDPDITERLTIGMYHDGGGTIGEFEISFGIFSNSMPFSLLKVFDDAWAAMLAFPEFLMFMAKLNGDDIDVDGFCSVLIEIGIEDATEAEQRKL